MKKLLLIALCLSSASAYADNYKEPPMSEKLKSLWSDPVLQEKMQIGIEHNRKGDFYLEFRDWKNRPVKVENLKIEMVSHDFLFGAQIFLLGGFDTPKKNALYEKYFTELFNFATVPFYWGRFEEEDGVFAFGKNDKRNNKMPSQDALVEFCKAHGLAMKGHPLSWYISNFWGFGNTGVPEWVPSDEREIEKYLTRYIGKVAERYSRDICIWDVSNEASDTRFAREYMGYVNTYPFDHAFKAFKEAERVLPHSNNLIVNCATPVWLRTAKYGEYGQDYLMISSLINRGAKVDIIGLQLHFFNRERRAALYSGEQWTPDDQYAVLDKFATLNRPIHITELSFPCMGEGAIGEEKQAFILENFYTLWFSHPAVEAITYWYFVDGTAGAENVYNSGFLRRDFSKKKAYEVLDNLVNKKWRTNLSFPEAASERHFRAFYGKYKVSFEHNGKRVEKFTILSNGKRVADTLSLTKRARNHFIIIVE